MAFPARIQPPAANEPSRKTNVNRNRPLGWARTPGMINMATNRNIMIPNSRLRPPDAGRRRPPRGWQNTNYSWLRSCRGRGRVRYRSWQPTAQSGKAECRHCTLPPPCERSQPMWREWVRAGGCQAQARAHYRRSRIPQSNLDVPCLGCRRSVPRSTGPRVEAGSGFCFLLSAVSKA
jgi:hypothetical protein